MEEVRGNLWDLHATGDECYQRAWVVIPTNLGWKNNGANVMGRGLALQAAQKYPGLPMEYGKFCQVVRSQDRKCMFDEEKCLVLAPSKPLDADHPWLSWQQGSDPELVKRSLHEIYEWTVLVQEDFGLPLLGTGNGGLDRKLVLDMTREILGGVRWCCLYL